MKTDRYAVSGMTCAHCVSAVSSEVSKISGVSAVDVDLAAGEITVAGEDYTDEQVREAVEEAGYEFAAR